jgi:ribosomal protein L40E
MLVACPECNSRISDQANPCPQCGFPKGGHHSKEAREHIAREYESKGVYLGTVIRENHQCSEYHRNQPYSEQVVAEVSKSRPPHAGYNLELSALCPKCNARSRVLMTNVRTY